MFQATFNIICILFVICAPFSPLNGNAYAVTPDLKTKPELNSNTVKQDPSNSLNELSTQIAQKDSVPAQKTPLNALSQINIDEEYISADDINFFDTNATPIKRKSTANQTGPSVSNATQTEAAKPEITQNATASTTADPASTDKGAVLTLHEACRLAVLHHPLIDRALATRQEEEANYNISKSVYYPRIDFQANLGPKHDLKTDITEYGDSSVSMTQTIFNFGGLQDEVASARLKADSARLRFARTNEDIAALTINSYLTILQAKQLLRVYENSLQFYQKLLETFWERYNAGISSKADAQKVEVSLKSTESQLVIQNEQFKTAKVLLENIIKQSVADIEPNVNLLKVGILGNAEDSYSRALNFNISLRATQAEIESQKMVISAKSTEYLPSLGYKLQAKNEMQQHNDDKNSFDAQLTLNWNLFNGFATDEKIKKEEAILKRLEATKHTTELEIKNILDNAFNSYDSSAKEYQLAKEAYDSSIYLMSLYLSEFDLGIRTLLDLITAREGQTSAAVREVNARFARIRATLNIILEEGRLADVLNLPIEKGFL
ncbi:outer membrane protein, adhesin transport system [Maridesulfovibrio ferrireducens]|uniref:Outer membrane protein, adhesin transport system n=1 Tax=Maridesulfovibrio ferrireducens TaxID=246191 RepID=A0A1G9LNE4_9BACT|nr:TolC family protein [Maridesulfovibrio ferrireducens]SDL63446.1 outer membrane protein, adhesin transport system [Maridesulfovibrio ferrireducens]